MPLLSIAAHHSEPGDPVLIDWIIHIIQSITGLGSLPLLIIIGLIVVAIPVGILAVFLVQRAKFDA